MMDFKIIKISYRPPDFLNIGYDDLFSKIKRVEIQNVLIQSFDKFIFIVDIEWRKKPDNDFIKNINIVDDSVEFLISKNRTICLISSKLPKEYSEVLLSLSSNFECFIEFPITLEKKNITGNIVGNQKNINKFLGFIGNLDIDFNIISNKKFIPKGHGVLSSLTVNQLKCLEVAVKNGYFDFPKKNDSRGMASKLKINHSTFLEHIRKAEKKIFDNLFRI